MKSPTSEQLATVQAKIERLKSREERLAGLLDKKRAILIGSVVLALARRGDEATQGYLKYLLSNTTLDTENTQLIQTLLS